MKPIEVFALDEKMNRATLSIPYNSLEWHRCYYECGDFTLEVPADIYDPSWKYIYTDDRPETGIIEKVTYTDDPKYGNVDTVVLKGRFLESIMNRRTFLDETPEEVTYRYYVSPPKPPRKEVIDAELYVDETGKYWYPTPSGNSYGVNDGNTDPTYRVPGGKIEVAEDGSASVVSGGQTIKLNKVNALEQINSFCYTDGSSTDINRVQNFGVTTKETTHKIAFDDGFGHVYYHDSEQGVMKYATGVTEKKEDSYEVKYKEWAASTDNGWVTKTKTVKGPWQVTGTTDPITPMDNIARCVQWAQMYFQNDMLFLEPEIEGVVKTVDPSFELLGDLLYRELQTVGASFRLRFDFINAQFVFSVIKGLDRTQAQSKTPWAVFSDTWGTLYGYTADRDDSGYRNKCFVLYEYDEPQGFEADGSPKVEEVIGEDGSQNGWKVPYTTKRGFYTVRIDDRLDDRETYLDLRKEPPACDSEWEREYSGTEKPVLPTGLKEQYENFPEALKSQGMAHLTNECAKETSLDTGSLEAVGYLKDYDIGDKVDMAVSTVGLVQTGRITEVSEIYDASGPSVNVVISETELEEV